MRKLVPALLLLLLHAPILLSQSADDLVGDWTGAIDAMGQKLEIEITLVNDGGWEGTIDIPIQGIHDLALEGIEVDPPKVTFKLGGGIPGDPTMHLEVNDAETMTGRFEQGGASFPVRLTKLTPSDRAAAAASEAAVIEEIRAFLKQSIEDWEIPGMAVAIVRGDEVLMAEGFGYRDVEARQPVTGTTLFAIGSTTKAFTATLLGTLVDEGRLEWDAPVTDYLPEFRLKEDAATELLTVRDLLTHVSGLPRHDILWYGSRESRGELVSRLRYLEPTAPPRQKWQYNNLMFMTAGYLAEKITGSTWEDLLRERLFDPLGMAGSNTSVVESQTTTDFAQPYGKRGGAMKRVDFRSIDAAGPAGSINSSASDMSRWLRLNLNEGELDGRRIVEGPTLYEIHDPKVVISGETGHDEVLFNLYALGWMVNAYRGHKLLQHGGGIDGFTAQVALMPGEDLGVVILANREGTPFPELASWTIFDRLLGLDPIDWSGTALASGAKAEAEAEEEEEPKPSVIERVPDTKPSHALAAYAGTYRHPAYGDITIALDGKKLKAAYHDEALDLNHYHYDLFEGKDEKLPESSMFVQFHLNVDGDVAALSLPLEPMVDPIRFERRPDDRMRDPDFLKRYTGEYELDGMVATVAVRDSALMVTIPGQPTYTLEPLSKEGLFGIEGLDGFRVRFEGERNGAASRLMFLQPNGTFVLERK